MKRGPVAAAGRRSAAPDTLLDRFLAGLRAKKASRLIPPRLTDGRVLDVGCGRRPAFLARRAPGGRVGLDRVAPEIRPRGAHFLLFDVEQPGSFPFADASFDVVTMLAVLEHIRPERRPHVLDEVYRVLRTGGALVVTTPPPRTDALLVLLRRVGLVSDHMTEGHQDLLTRRDIAGLLARTRFVGAPLRTGYFELFMNAWVVAAKPAAAGAGSDPRGEG